MDIHYVQGIVGPHEVGVIVSTFLFGVLSVQGFNYYEKSYDDTKKTSGMVCLTWCLLLVHNILAPFSMYERTVNNFGNMEALYNYPWSFGVLIAVSGTTACLIQSFFAHRLYLISESRIIPFLCWILSILRFASVIGIAITARKVKLISVYNHQYRWLIVTSLSISASVDILIAASLSYSLWYRRINAFRSTQRVLDRLIAWTIQTGLLTSVATVLQMIFFLAMNNFAWVSVQLILPGLFANTLLASLNGRESLRDALSDQRITIPTIVDAKSHNHRFLMDPSFPSSEYPVEIHTTQTVSTR